MRKFSLTLYHVISGFIEPVPPKWRQSIIGHVIKVKLPESFRYKLPPDACVITCSTPNEIAFYCFYIAVDCDE